MNSELLLKSIKELASALHTLGYHLPSHEDKDIVYGHLQRFEKLQAELRADMQINGSTPPQLNKAHVMCRAGDLVKEVGGDWIKVLKVEGRNVYLDYGDGLNCLDVDDIIAWRHGT